MILEYFQKLAMMIESLLNWDDNVEIVIVFVIVIFLILV